jgi:predicted acetyltransferase
MTDEDNLASKKAILANGGRDLKRSGIGLDFNALSER